MNILRQYVGYRDPCPETSEWEDQCIRGIPSVPERHGFRVSHAHFPKRAFKRQAWTEDCGLRMRQYHSNNENCLACSSIRWFMECCC